MGLVILAGVALMITAMLTRRKQREMEHRERLAMIERGLMPSPESDPGAFEAAAGFTTRSEEPGVRYRTAGVLMIGFGLAMVLLIGGTAKAEIGVGIGGAWVILGAASLVNYYLISRREEERGRSRRWTPPPPRTPEPPTNIVP